MNKFDCRQPSAHDAREAVRDGARGAIIRQLISAPGYRRSKVMAQLSAYRRLSASAGVA